MKSAEKFIAGKLAERKNADSYRILKPENNLVDFCSNDYLGFARSTQLKESIQLEIKNKPVVSNGATGSRLLSGNSTYIENLEEKIAAVHGAEAALIFNSGYDANIGLFSSIAQRGDTIITDELIHASIIDGARLSHANRYTFIHNDMDSLESKLKQAKGNIYVAIESVYSMDGDTPPINAILELTEKFNANLIIDEAHAIGLYKYGLVEQSIKERVFARIITFGKALGVHGAAVLGSKSLRAYLINFARSFIYTTAPSFYQLASIKMAYVLLEHSDVEINSLKDNISLFKQSLEKPVKRNLIGSDSAIQCIVLKSNKKAKAVAQHLQTNGLDVRAILHPTVKEGSERVRICLHAFNTEKEIILLANILNSLEDAG